jgi:hypothetical protein
LLTCTQAENTSFSDTYREESTLTPKHKKMSKKLIEKALKQAITDENLHELTLHLGSVYQRENKFTSPMALLLPNCYAQAETQNLYNQNTIIDLVSFVKPAKISNNLIPDATKKGINWALEAKHYCPHQSPGFQSYLNYSLGGALLDLLKLTDCGFNKFYSLQIQTEVTNFTINHPYGYSDLMAAFPFFKPYLGGSVSIARENIARIAAQNRMKELEVFSRAILDKKLICNSMSTTVKDAVAEVDVTIHYLISGPFDRATIVAKMTEQRYKPDQSYEVQAKAKNKVMELDVRIESDPEE